MTSYEYSYLFVCTLIVVAAGFAIAPLLLSSWLRPRMPSTSKQSTYECGLESSGDSWIQFKVHYYIYALIFLIFDLEAIFLLPWAVAFNKLGLFAFVEMIIFLGILVAGFIWAWKKGALEWK